MNKLWRPPTIPKGWTATKRLVGHWELNCPHGVGHPDPRDPNLKHDGIHGCDGCCSIFADWVKPVDTTQAD
jgi:hypothetical protein